MKKLKTLIDNRGQAVIEFALIIPIFLFMVFSLVDISRLIYYNSTINNACKEALRMASLGNSVSSIANRINYLVNPLVGNSTASVSSAADGSGNPCTKITITPSSGSSMVAYITPAYTSSLKQGDSIGISIEYPFKYITPINTIFSNITTIKASYSTAMEAPPK